MPSQIPSNLCPLAQISDGTVLGRFDQVDRFPQQGSGFLQTISLQEAQDDHLTLVLGQPLLDGLEDVLE
jgi:hypothetical protein